MASSLADFDIRFLSREEAARAICEDADEPYFSVLQRAEMSAKTGLRELPADLAEARAKCRAEYAAAAREFSAEEQAAIIAVLEGIYSVLRRAFPLMAATPWRLVKLADSIEGGLPHTRGPCVVVCQSHVKEMLANPDFAVETLVHEQSHVVQRLHPGRFRALYESWGFARMDNDPAARLEPNHSFLRCQIKNPDGVDCCWAFPLGERVVQPLIVLSGDVNATFHNLTMVCATVARHDDGWRYVLTAGGEVETTPLMKTRAYAEAFAPSNNIYHPNETFADLFVRVLRGLLGLLDDRPLPEEDKLAWVEQWSCEQRA
jgi:hypothetical protein